MHLLRITLLLLGLTALSASVVHPEAKMPFLKYCRYFNYPVEAHTVVTQDGYILTVFRIQAKGTAIKEGLKPILLQHGLVDSSDTWIVNDQDKAPGLMLADKGYDVWLGNNRGNKHSRNHTTLNPDKGSKFWQFTYQDMADFDLPSMFTYISKVSSQKVSYIGHSQGTIQMHIALSKNNPVIESLIDQYFAFGPVGVIQHSYSNLMNLIAQANVVGWFERMHIYEFMPTLNWFETDAGVLFCGAFPKVCDDFIGQVCDADPKLDNYERFDVLAGHDPSGTSVMNMDHWRQAFQGGKFQAYDYGSQELNKVHYGQSTPPMWDLKKIKVPMRLFAGSSDRLADETDVQWLWTALSDQVKTFYKTYSSGHLTFLWGNDVSPWMNDVFSILQQK